MNKISLTRNMFSIVSDEWFTHLNKWKWFAMRNKTSKTFYAARHQWVHGKRTSKRIYMHRVIMNARPGEQVDHKDGNGLNNLESNMRIASHSQNSFNTGLSKSNSSGYKGVSWSKGMKKWRSRIRIQGKETIIGYFDNLIEAAKARNEATIKHHGEFAWLNKIPESHV